MESMTTLLLNKLGNCVVSSHTRLLTQAYIRHQISFGYCVITEKSPVYTWIVEKGVNLTIKSIVTVVATPAACSFFPYAE